MEDFNLEVNAGEDEINVTGTVMSRKGKVKIAGSAIRFIAKQFALAFAGATEDNQKELMSKAVEEIVEENKKQ